ncbi:MAG: glycoside hydrolase TIM-barrel-like domain-containing protein [Hyphomicrobiales bacterium]|nr:glycoside hydrolase TIM-barrel-like domain-containing protein [Hyphomicrobiales bacterium]
MVHAIGVHLLPSTGEWAYDTIPFSAAQWDFFTATVENPLPTNTFNAPGGLKTDLDYALDQLQAQHPECTTVSVVISWFFNSEDASACQVYPSTIYLKGAVWEISGGVPVSSHWMCSGLTEQSFPGIIPMPTTGADSAAILEYFLGAIPDPSAQLGSYVYGGTPSDPAIVRCIRDLKARGFRVVFYPFLLSTAAGYPWRGRITYANDVSAAATAAVNAFLGSASTSQFVRDTTNLTVNYTGYLFDWTYRRMILHYANLMIVAGGVDLFVIGSELRGLETIRGPGWTKAGTTDGSGYAVWDYPFVAGLIQLADDVRATFDAAGMTKDLTHSKNLIVYSADWSSWMGWQHPGANGQWPHLDSLWAHANIDFVSFDNYLPLTDWTTGGGGLDVLNWSAPPWSGPWPPPSTNLNGLGLSGVPSIYSTAYLKSQIEGGQYFDWFYYSGGAGAHGGFGLDPLGSGLQVTVPTGDRAAQARNPYYENQQILAPKQLRWWWNNPHQAVYDNGDGHGWTPHGPQTEWTPQSKSILNLEYGFSAVDKATNQPNVFFDAKSTESSTPYWSIWDSAYGQTWLPRRDDTIAALALEAVYEYWNTDGHNATSGAGLPMLLWTFSCVWNWDARPFPTFPIENQTWGDTGNWQQGDWSNGLRVSLVPPQPTPPPSPPSFSTFPTVATLGWSVHVRPRYATDVAAKVSGREARRSAHANPYFDLELTYEVLRAAAPSHELQTIAGFFEQMGGAAMPFFFAPPGLSTVSGQRIGTGDGTTTSFALMQIVGGATLPVYGTSGVSAVYLNGVSQASGWSASSGYAPAITFSTAPALGVAIAADFGALWLCRFTEDVLDLEEFMAILWALRTLKLKTVRP